MKNKKSQIGMFIIFGLIIAIAMGFVLYLKNIQKNNVTEKTSESSFEFQPVRNFIENCIDKTAKDGLIILGLQGGYISLPDKSTQDLIPNVPFYLYEGQNLLPKKEKIESELNFFIAHELPLCFDNFKSLKELGYSINFQDLNVNSKITKDVIIELNFKLESEKGTSKQELTKVSKPVNTRIGTIYDIISRIIASQNQNTIDIYELAHIALDNNLTINVEGLENGIIVFKIVDNVTIPNKPYIFRFAIKHKLGNITNQTIVKKVIIGKIPYQIVEQDYSFTYKVNATGRSLKFFDYTPLFDINQDTGIISFVPKKENAGRHTAWIGARDNDGNEDLTSFVIDIKGFNSKPKLVPTFEQKAKVGTQFFYDFNATDADNDTLFFDDNTDLFNIGLSDGIVKFIPNEAQIGIYNINITVVDSKSAIDFDVFKLVIEK